MKKSKINLIQIVIVLCTVNNIFHGAVFYHLSFHDGREPESFWEFFSSLDNFQSFFVMFVVDLALIALVSYGNTEKDAKVASVLAWCLFVINIFFAGVVDDVMNYQFTFSNSKLLSALVGKTLFSGLFSYIIHYFSVFNLRLKHENEERYSVERDFELMQQEMSILEQRYSKNQALISTLQADLEQFAAQKSNEQALLESKKATENQLIALQKEVAKEKIMRTIYFPDVQELESARSVNAKVGFLTDLQKEQHFSEKERQLRQLDEIYSVS